MKQAVGLLLVLGCGSAAPKPPVANVAPKPAAAPPAPAMPKGCSLGTTFGDDEQVPAVLDGAKIEVAHCEVAEVPVEGTDGKSTDMAAYLVRDGQGFYVGKWNEGWEWGGSWTLTGVLATKVVVLTESSFGMDMHSSTVHAYQRTGESWHEAYTSDRVDEVQVEIAADRQSATVTSCADDDPNKICMDDPAKHQVVHLTWDGTKLRSN